ncbi:hypothetical protein Tco_0496864, partial [Tanacetum coccineum]
MSSASSVVTYTSVYTNSEPERSVAPPSPDYIPGPEEPQTPPVPLDEDERKPMFLQPHDPDYVPEPIYPEYIPLEDEHVFPAEKQPLPPVVSPTAESPGYVVESDPEEDPKEYEDDETEDGPVDYPMDGGKDGDDDDGDSHGDDADDEDEDEEDDDEEDEEEEEEEEHLAPADSAVVASISLPPEAEVDRLLTMPTPPPSPLISLLPPSARERLARCTAPSAHSSPPPVPSPLLPSSGCPTQIQTLKIASTQALVDAVTAWPPSKRSCLFALGPRYEVGESSIARPTRGRGLDYGFVNTVDAEVNTKVTKLAELHELDTHDLYALLEDAHNSRTRISQRVTMDSQRVDLLMEDMIAHQETILIIEEEAYASREAWAHSVGLSQAVHYELQTHCEQAELLALREQQRRARQSGPDGRVPDHQDASRDADSHLYISSLLSASVMSSASSAVTYTSVYTDSEPGRPLAPPSPDYIPDSKEPQTPPVPHDEDEREPMFIQPHDPDYVPEPIYPEYIPLEDEHEFLVEEQPLPLVDSPTDESPGYVVESDPEEDPEEYEDDETEDGPVDYLIDRGEDGDDDDDDSSGDDADDEDEDRGDEDDEDEDEDEEEEHLALADSVVVVPTVELISPHKGTEPVIPPPSTDITTTGARITVRLQAS